MSVCEIRCVTPSNSSQTQAYQFLQSASSGYLNSFSITMSYSMRCWTITTKNSTALNSSPPARETMPSSSWNGNDFDYDRVEDLKGYVVELPKSAKYAQILKNSVAFKETVNERIFLMKDLAAVEEAVGLGAKIVDGEIAF